MVANGYSKVELWVPEVFVPHIRSYADGLRDLVKPPSKELTVWNVEKLNDLLKTQEAYEQGLWETEVLHGDVPCLVLTRKDEGDLEIFIVASNSQVLVSTPLIALSQIGDVAGWNERLMRMNKMMPLSTVGIADTANGPVYEIYGALSSMSHPDQVIEEIEALTDNALEISATLMPAAA